MGKIDTALQWMIDLANSKDHGYSQSRRWGPDYDCSSAIISAWEYAGVPVKTAGATYTGDMKAAFLKCGFKDVTSSCDLNTCAGLQPGDVLLNEINHTEMYVGNKQDVAAHSDRGNPAEGDQDGTEISVSAYYNYPWDCVLRYCGDNTGGTSTTQKLTLGSSGPEVKAMQQKLMMLGYDCGSSGADGEFGNATLAAVKSFQGKNGITTNGIYGPTTRKKAEAQYKALGVFTATCNLAGLKVRTGDSTNYAIFSAYPSLKKGEKVKVARVTSNNWYFALVGERYVAYMAAKYMKKG